MEFQLKTVNIAFTHKCNQKCIHCYVGHKTKEFLIDSSLEKWCSWILQAKELGACLVSFGGGESFVRKDFPEFLEFINGIGLKAGVITNGMFSNIDAYVNVNTIDTLSVSLDFPTQTEHDKFRGVNGAFVNAIETIKNAKNVGINVEVLSTFTRLNCKPEILLGLKDLISGNGIKKWKLNRYKHLGNGIENNLDLTPEQLFFYHEFIISNRKPADPVEPILAGLWGIGTKRINCPCGKSTIRIGFNGDVYSCVYIKKAIGNLNEKSLEYYWKESLELAEFREQLDYLPLDCIKCDSRNICHGGCAANSFLEYKETRRKDPYCYKNFIKVPSNYKINVDLITDSYLDSMQGIVGSNYVSF